MYLYWATWCVGHTHRSWQITSTKGSEVNNTFVDLHKSLMQLASMSNVTLGKHKGLAAFLLWASCTKTLSSTSMFAQKGTLVENWLWYLLLDVVVIGRRTGLLMHASVVSYLHISPCLCKDICATFLSVWLSQVPTSAHQEESPLVSSAWLFTRAVRGALKR